MVVEHKSTMLHFDCCVVGLVHNTEDQLGFAEGHLGVEASGIHAERIEITAGSDVMVHSERRFDTLVRRMYSVPGSTDPRLTSCS